VGHGEGRAVGWENKSDTTDEGGRGSDERERRERRIETQAHLAEERWCLYKWNGTYGRS